MVMNKFKSESNKIPIKYICIQKLQNREPSEFTLVGVLHNDPSTRCYKKSQYSYFSIGTIVYNKKDDVMELHHDEYIIDKWNFRNEKFGKEDRQEYIFSFTDIKQLESHIQTCYMMLLSLDFLQLSSASFLKFISELYIELHEYHGREFTITEFEPTMCKFSMKGRYTVTIKQKYSNTRKKLFLVVNFEDHKVSENSTKLKVDMNKCSRKKYIKRMIRDILFKTYLDIKINRF